MNLLCLPLPIKRKSESEVAQSCLTVCDPVDCSLPGSSIHGIFQARVLEWVVISFSRGYSWPRDWTRVSLIAGRCFYRLSHGSLIKAIRLFVTTSPKTLSPRFYSVSVRTKAKFWLQYPYKKTKSGHTKRHQRRVCTDRGPCEEAAGRWPSASQEETSGKTVGNLILNFHPPELWENRFLLFKTPSIVVFCYGRLSKLIQYSKEKQHLEDRKLRGL